jgi:coenzyme F420-0:L-glutamate ligase/coenzyme F420-1:gamma-L-glutamate ligase
LPKGNKNMNSIHLHPLKDIKEINVGDCIGEIIIDSIEKSGLLIENGDIFVVAHKIISKAEGRIVELSKINPSSEAYRISKISGKSPPLVESILQESSQILKKTKEGVIISRNKLGFVCANAGIDQSNSVSPDHVVLLPKNPDKSAYNLRIQLEKYFNRSIAIIINDTHGRPFREGAVGVAIGSSGINPLKSYIGKKDRNGYTLKSSIEAIADEIASAATLIMGQCDEGRPIVIIKGFKYEYSSNGLLNNIVRNPSKDLFF